MEYYNIGKIVNTQGLKGEVRIVPITDFPDSRFKPGNVVYAQTEGSQSRKTLTIKTARKHKGFILVSFAGYNSINDIEFLKPSTLQIAETQLTDSDLKDGEYYYHQIIGLEVYDLQNKHLGTISEILSPGANDVWIVSRPNQNDLLLPKIDQVIKKVDLNQKRVTVELMEGME